jgi:hypothetical protein
VRIAMAIATLDVCHLYVKHSNRLFDSNFATKPAPSQKKRLDGRMRPRRRAFLPSSRWCSKGTRGVTHAAEGLAHSPPAKPISGQTHAKLPLILGAKAAG